MPTLTSETLTGWLAASPFQGYAYAYPHKTAYRPLAPPVPLTPLWAEEDRQHLFLYVHVPFCEMRCGFCNLFTTTHPASDHVGRWLDALLQQAEATSEIIGADAQFARGAIGGGTPTFLTEAELTRLLEACGATLDAGWRGTPLSVEMSPATVTADKLALLRAHGMERASLGVQSFVAEEVTQAGRAQQAGEVDRALRLMAASGVPVRNIDLIYGIPGQTPATWRHSLEAAVAYAPEEIYLYPLYVRPLTGLQRLQREPGDNREDLYRTGRDWLLEHGYRQVSMRLFRARHHPGIVEPVYVCQEDGMVGLGPGARSYTQRLHYSSDYAVGRASILQIIEAFITRDRDADHVASHGAWLAHGEQQRRFLIKSLLRADGIDAAAYRARFGTGLFDDWPLLHELGEHDLGEITEGGVRLTSEGLAWSDSIGPWLYSAAMRRQMADYAWT